MLRINAPSVSLSQYRGKVVALAFIQTTCPHCQRLTTGLTEIAPEYAPHGVQFLLCAFNSDASATLPEFIERFHPPFPVLFSSQSAVMSYLQIPIFDPRPVYVPRMVFLDRAGVIRADYPGDDPFFHDPVPNVREVLDKLLKAKSAPAKK
jgi:peroxiredoxin